MGNVCFEELDTLLKTIDVNDKELYPLHWAASAEEKFCLEYLLNLNIFDVDQKDENGQTPLHIAAKNGTGEIVSCLLKEKANTKIQDNQLNIPLHLAVKYSNFETVTELCKLSKSPLHIKNELGQTPYDIACIYQDYPIMRKLSRLAPSTSQELKDNYLLVQIPMKTNNNLFLFLFPIAKRLFF